MRSKRLWRQLSGSMDCFVTKLITRLWDIPTKDELVRMFEAGTLVHAAVCTFESDRFLEPRAKMAEDYLRLGGLDGFCVC